MKRGYRCGGVLAALLAACSGKLDDCRQALTCPQLPDVLPENPAPSETDVASDVAASSGSGSERPAVVAAPAENGRLGASTTSPPPCDGCELGGLCRPQGGAHPDNPCLSCGTGPTAGLWIPSSGSCDDGLFCTEGDTCSAGTCSGLPRSCPGGVGVAGCDEENRQCAVASPLTGLIASSYSATCAVRSGGAVYCWGGSSIANAAAVPGLNEPLSPTQVPLPAPARSLAVENGGCAVLQDGGEVHCWGFEPVTTDNVYPPRAVPGVAGVTQLDLADGRAAAVSGLGQGELWGSRYNQYSASPALFGFVPPFAEAGSSTGTAAVVGISEAVEIAIGPTHGCALLVSGEVRCWGYGYGVGPAAANGAFVPLPTRVELPVSAVSIDTRNSETCAVGSDGSLFCWGGMGATASAQPYVLGGFSDAIQVVVGAAGSSCVLQRSGKVACWGIGQNGALGNGGTADASTPLQVPNLTGIVSLGRSSGTSFCALQGSTRDVYCWGSNFYGQLGDGSTSDRLFPVRVQGLPD
jgi:hypothetical protein